MANLNTQVTLDAVHAGIIAAIKAQFPDLKTVEAYRLDRKSLPVPACLVELTEMESADLQPGTEQEAVEAIFEAKLIIGFRQGLLNPKLEIRKLAAAFIAFVGNNRWGCPIGPANFTGAYPDDFDPELDQFECWRVEWRQTIHVGSSVWEYSGTAPSTVLLGISPEIGIPHKDDYTQVFP